jgi:hypothetical protein
MSMSWLGKLASFIGIESTNITLIGEEREGGYLFISSPELKGFSLLLEPGDYSDFKNFIDAVFEPLTAYMNTYDEARRQARKIANRDRLRLRATKLNGDGALVATMCFQ